MPDPADHAYAHAVAVLGAGPAAVEVAAEAVRRGGRSRSAVLGYARHGALAGAGRAEPADLDAEPPDDLAALAALLAAARPPLERAVVDLHSRHGLSPGGFARAIGLPPAAAAVTAAAVQADWHRDLDPVLLARLGAADCPGLAAALGDAEGRPRAGAGAGEDGPLPASVRRLLAAAPAAGRHAAGCPSCQDRLRAMVSVRTLVGQRPLEEAPAAVRTAGAHARLLRFPARPPPAPPLDPAAAGPAAGSGSARPRLDPATLVAALVVVTVVLVAVAAGVVAGGGGGRQARLEALTRVPAAGATLRVDPPAVGERWPAEVTVHNGSPRPATWSATSDVGWLTVEPDGGRLAPGSAAVLRITMAGAPEGDVRTVVRISGADGSAAQVEVATRVEHPPELSVSRRGCDVVALVEDEAGLSGVTLHWRGSHEGSAPLAMARPGFRGRLPAGARELTWWVAAVDARGNQARSPDAPVAPGSC